MKTERIVDAIAYSLLAIICFGACGLVMVTMYNSIAIVITRVVIVLLMCGIVYAVVLMISMIMYDMMCDADRDRVRAQ